MLSAFVMPARPIRIQLEFTTRTTPEEIAAAILDMSRWPEFDGWGPLPGIRSAEVEHHEAGVVGTRIRVMNRDGSTHVEEMTAWEPPDRLELTLSSFPAPLRWLASRMVETWAFRSTDKTWVVSRSMVIEPKHTVARWGLVPVAFMLRRAMMRHVAPLTTGRPA